MCRTQGSIRVPFSPQAALLTCPVVAFGLTQILQQKCLYGWEIMLPITFLIWLGPISSVRVSQQRICSFSLCYIVQQLKLHFC